MNISAWNESITLAVVLRVVRRYEEFRWWIDEEDE